METIPSDPHRISTGFDIASFRLPREHSSYNDDVRLECFRDADWASAGKQRKEIHEPLDSFRSIDRHIRDASRDGFPLFCETHLPKELRKAAICTRDTPPDQLRPILEAHRRGVGKLVGNCAPAQSKWDACARRDILPAAGRLRTVGINHLMRKFGVGMNGGSTRSLRDYRAAIAELTPSGGRERGEMHPICPAIRINWFSSPRTRIQFRV